ncbi:MAG: RsmB/NOP family class I SAM-dependent RNA methyltransferase [Candidatus Nitrosocosmicus sp.]
MNHEIEYFDFFPNEYSKKLAEKYGYKDWMVSRFLNFIPNTEILLEYIESNYRNKSSNFEYIRANNLKIESESLKRRLIEKGYDLKDTLLKEVFKIEKVKDTDKTIKKTSLSSIGSTLEYLKGYYYIQDLSSCIAVDELEINENNCTTVLDMAASPGGKTTFIAQKMKNKGNIIACEPNPKRIPALIFNLSRCNVKNTTIFSIPGENIEKLSMKFDRILLDAPCSCEGIITKDETRKNSRNLKDIEICSIKQKKLIHSALQVLKSGGIMIYCTCSFAPEENEMIIDELVRNNKDGDIEIEPVKYGINGLTEFNNHQFKKELSNTKRLYPHIHNTNGFFIAKLRKK